MNIYILTPHVYTYTLKCAGTNKCLINSGRGDDDDVGDHGNRFSRDERRALRSEFLGGTLG